MPLELNSFCNNNNNNNNNESSTLEVVVQTDLFSIQCFDTVGWATGRASGT